MNEVDLLEQRVNELVEEIKKLREKQQEQKVQRWRAKEGEIYWIVTTSGEAGYDREECDNIDDSRYSIGNYFASKQDVEQHIKNLKTKQKLKDLALELNKGKEMDWEDSRQCKHIIVYDKNHHKLGLGGSYCVMEMGQVYCLDNDFLKKALTVIGEEDLIDLIKSGV